MGIYQLFIKKMQVLGLKTACLLSAIGGRIVASAHPMFVAVDVWQTEQQEDYL